MSAHLYPGSEYERLNLQVARAHGAQAAVDQALARTRTVKSIPQWLIAYLESAVERMPGLAKDLAAYRNTFPMSVRATRGKE